MCAGSAYCNNGQPLRDQCAEAFGKVQDVVYTVDGKYVDILQFPSVSGINSAPTNAQQPSGAGGVCSGHCGFFLEGHGCRATEQEFVEAYGTIRHVNNCLTCGYAFKPRTNGMFST